MSIRQFTCTLRSSSTYSQSNYFTTPKSLKTKHDEYDASNWREHAHVVSDGPCAGQVFIPAQQFKNCLVDAAKYLGMKIVGKGQSTYTKHFKAGVQVLGDLVLPIKVGDLEHEGVMCAADGVTGSATKVLRRFPIIKSWSGQVVYLVADDTIDEATFLTHLGHAGQLIGIGRWRPINNGKYGKYLVDDVTVAEIEPPVLQVKRK